MKKVISLLLFMLVLCLAGSAMADYLPGDTVTVSVSITSNPNAKAAGAVMVKASNSSVLVFQSASKTMNVNGFAPQADGASFSLMAYDLTTPIPAGAVGTVTYKIAADAAPGTYTINVSSAAFGVSGTKTVVVGKPDCEHNWGTGVETTAPTCDDPGVKTFTCSKCNETKTEDIEALGHSYDKSNGVVTKEPTCVEEGVKTFYCQNDNTHTTTEPIPATEKHEWTETIIKDATCTEDGEKLMKCSVCDEEDPQVIEAAGHTPSDTAVKVDPTCTENGSITYNCTVCGEKVEGEVLEAIGHKWDEGTVTTAATCGSDGEKLFTCQNGCGETRTEEIEALGHKWDDGKETTAPTCVDKGEKTFTCQNDASHTRTEEIPATKIHTPGADAVIVPATCTTDGSETYNCTVCGTKVSGKKIPATGHAWGEWVVTTEPTCTKKGEQTATCANDSSHTKTQSIRATGKHIWDEGKVTTEPTCTKDGKKTFTCTYDCGRTKTETIKRLGHAYDEGVVTKPATCTENGVKTYTCQNDAAHTKTERINKLGHDWGEWVITKPVTEEEDGEQQRICGRCDQVETKRISSRADYYMNVCSAGIRFRDMENPLTDAWYMFTPVDLSVEGEQTFELVAGNIHKIGYVTVAVADGNVTVTYKLFNSLEVHMYEEFLAILPSLSSIEELDYESMTTYEFREPISIEESLGGDTKVLLVLRNRALYKHGAKGVDTFKNVGEEYDAFVEELKAIMD